MTDYGRALQAFDKCLKLYKNFSDAEYYKAACLKYSKRNEEALVLMTQARDDFKQGYTINEDNVDYEVYPYQVARLATYERMIGWFQEASK